MTAMTTNQNLGYFTTSALNFLAAMISSFVRSVPVRREGRRGDQLLLQVLVEVVLEADEPGLLLGGGEHDPLIAPDLELALAVYDHGALLRLAHRDGYRALRGHNEWPRGQPERGDRGDHERLDTRVDEERKGTRLNSSHGH